MSNRKNISGEIDGLAKGGAIVSIISSGFGLFIMFIYGILLAFATDTVTQEVATTIWIVVGSILLVLSIFQLLALIFNIMFLIKKTDSAKIKAAIFALIAFSILGGILTLCGKVTVKEKPKQDYHSPAIDLDALGVN